MHELVSPPALPHILMLTCHDLGRHLGCYGVTTVRSPHLDALAAEGVRCDAAFTTSPSCSPSRSALATGRYPHSNGVMGLTHPPFAWDLRDGEKHIAYILSAAGYETHLFGFQHVTGTIDRLGFQHVHGFDRLLGSHEPALGELVAPEVVGFLNGPMSGRPLYLEVNLEEAHRPYEQGGGLPDEIQGVSIPEYLPQDATAREEMAALQGAVHRGDEALGRILQALRARGMERSTLVIFMADHGIAMPRAKCTLYDPGIEVALLLRWPDGEVSGGRSIPDLISNIDVLPTILELAGLLVPADVQGRSFGPLLRGMPSAPRSSIFAEKSFHSYYDPMRAIRTNRFKYIRNFEVTFTVEVPGDVQMGPIFRRHVDLYHGSEHPPAELYDLADDPLERHNLVGDSRFAETQRRLAGELREWMEGTDDPLLRGPIPSPAYERARREVQGAGSQASRIDSDAS